MTNTKLVQELLAEITRSDISSRIMAKQNAPALGFPAMFALGMVAGDLVTRVIAAKKG